MASTRALVTQVFTPCKRSTSAFHRLPSSIVTNCTLAAHSYYKQHNYNTIVMGASFRNISEIEELCGIDFLTISPSLLEELKNSNKSLEQKLSVEKAGKAQPMEKVSFVDDEPKFRWELLDEQMAFDKLHEGIKKVRRDFRQQSISANKDLFSNSSLLMLLSSVVFYVPSWRRKVTRIR